MSIHSSKIIAPNHWYSILSVALVLILIGFFGMLLIQSTVLLENLKEQISIIIELKDDVTDEDIAKIDEKLRSSVFVKTNSIKFIDKAAAVETLKADFGDDFMLMDMVNPLHNVFIFNVKAAYLNEETIKVIRSKVMENLAVRDVYYQENMIDAIGKNVSKVAWIGLLIAAFFLLVAIFLIHNTMRLALYSKRFLIKNMEMVGATWSFISRPFLIKSMLNGLISSVIAIMVLGGLFVWLKSEIPALDIIKNQVWTMVLIAGILVLGILISSLSTYRVVQKYLSMRLDDLY